MTPPAITRPPSRIFNRAVKSGRFRERGAFTGGGGERSATTFPRLLISTCSPESIQSRTVLKSCRTCLMDAVFMLHNHVSHKTLGQSGKIESKSQFQSKCAEGANNTASHRAVSLLCPTPAGLLPAIPNLNRPPEDPFHSSSLALRTRNPHLRSKLKAN